LKETLKIMGIDGNTPISGSFANDQEYDIFALAWDWEGLGAAGRDRMSTIYDI